MLNEGGDGLGMEVTFGSRLIHAWNAFLNRDPMIYRQYVGPGYSYRPDRIIFSRGNERSIISSIYNRIALDASSIKIQHVRLDEEGRFEKVIDSGLNNCLTMEANIDQTGRAFIQDVVMSMLDEGCVAIVPVGLTKYRQGLAKLRPVDREEAAAVIDQVEAFAGKCLEQYGSRMFFCSDEFYIRAGRDLPEEEYYEGYVQLENGVGMLRSLITEFESGLRLEDEAVKAAPFTIATGVSARPFLQNLVDQAAAKLGVRGQVVAIVNDFFGHTIDVAGLITGGDLIAQLKGRDLGERLLIPVNMLRHGGDVFLDDVRVPDVEAALGVPVTVVEQDGFDLLDAVLGRK